jgi:hypothetical protein
MVIEAGDTVTTPHTRANLQIESLTNSINSTIKFVELAKEIPAPWLSTVLAWSWWSGLKNEINSHLHGHCWLQQIPITIRPQGRIGKSLNTPLCEYDRYYSQ